MNDTIGSGTCIPCWCAAERREQENEKNREYYRHIASNPPPLPELPADTPKMCTICLVTKRIDAFYRHKTKGTIRSACADCTKELKRQYYEENKERYVKKTNE